LQGRELALKEQIGLASDKTECVNFAILQVRLFQDVL